MLKPPILTAALAVACCIPLSAVAADDQQLLQIRNEIKQMKQSYEARIQALESKLQQVQAQSQLQAKAVDPAPPAPAAEPVAAPAVAAAPANAFNPSISLILGGTYANLSQDPSKYRLQGFMPGGEDNGPGKRSFNLGESELSFSANIDPSFAGTLTFSMAADNTLSVEEAFFQSQGLSNGINLKGGRFLSAIGYLNSQHSHVWDFVDAPLAYQAFLGGQYKPDGLQIKWLASTDRFFEAGLEVGNGVVFPGNDRNKNGFGSAALFAHLGDDIGDSASWRTGLSYLKSGSTNRTYSDVDHVGTTVVDAFSGNSGILIADGIFKWAPNGNATQTNVKLQGEYFHRNDNGTLTYDTQSQSLGTATGHYSSAQSGWYLQGIYQFMPLWRAGLRYDKLYSGTPNIGLIGNGGLTAVDFQTLSSYDPQRTTLMLDYSPSEFSRFRLQMARDQSRPGVIDNQLFLQYIMSLGTHGAHTF